MKILEKGHVYELDQLDKLGVSGKYMEMAYRTLVFVNREEDTEHQGTQTQDVIRCLIDRTQHCDGCMRWEKNDKIIWHLRQALALHESRALERKAEEGKYQPEDIVVDSDGHFMLHE